MIIGFSQFNCAASSSFDLNFLTRASESKRWSLYKFMRTMLVSELDPKDLETTSAKHCRAAHAAAAAPCHGSRLRSTIKAGLSSANIKGVHVKRQTRPNLLSWRDLSRVRFTALPYMYTGSNVTYPLHSFHLNNTRNASFSRGSRTLSCIHHATPEAILRKAEESTASAETGNQTRGCFATAAHKARQTTQRQRASSRFGRSIRHGPVWQKSSSCRVISSIAIVLCQASRSVPGRYETSCCHTSSASSDLAGCGNLAR